MPQYQFGHICNILPKETTSQFEQKKFASTYHNRIRQTANSSKDQHVTFGLQHHPPPDPCNFLKKHAKLPMSTLQNHKLVSYDIESPYQRDKFNTTPIEEKNLKNFISVNKQIKSTRDRTVYQPRYIDTRNGDTHNLHNSGLVTEYIFKKDFGKAPKYIQTLKQRLQQESQQCRKTFNGHKEQNQPWQISDEQRNDLLMRLKDNWAQLNKAYATQSICIDTLAKTKRKERLEEQLNAIEKDIKLLEASTEIYVEPQLEDVGINEANKGGTEQY